MGPYEREREALRAAQELSAATDALDELLERAPSKRTDKYTSELHAAVARVRLKNGAFKTAVRRTSTLVDL